MVNPWQTFSRYSHHCHCSFHYFVNPFARQLLSWLHLSSAIYCFTKQTDLSAMMTAFGSLSHLLAILASDDLFSSISIKVLVQTAVDSVALSFLRSFQIFCQRSRLPSPSQVDWLVLYQYYFAPIYHLLKSASSSAPTYLQQPTQQLVLIQPCCLFLKFIPPNQLSWPSTLAAYKWNWRCFEKQRLDAIELTLNF